MMLRDSRLSVMMAFVAISVGASAAMLDRPTGVKIGQRMTLRPYVALSVSWDSNVSSRHSNHDGDVRWTVNPGFGLEYRAENWALLMNGYYNYFAYCQSDHVSSRNQHTFGEDLRWNWANSQGGERGWAMMLSESFRQIGMADELTLGGGRGYNGDRREFDVNGGVRRNVNERWHGNVNAGYYLIQYDNERNDVSSLYGWQRWVAGVDGGYAPSKWTDIILSANYQGYQQENTAGTELGRESRGFTVQGGLGSYATERISYRLLAGWSRFDYADNASSDNGFVYTATGNWKLSETWHTMVLATSYYQPSERENASRSRVDSLSWGIAKSFVRGKLTTAFDIAYRHETNQKVNSNYPIDDYALDIGTCRLSVNYTLNRYLGLFCSGEYQRSWNSGSSINERFNDYDRWRVTGGVRLTY